MDRRKVATPALTCQAERTVDAIAHADPAIAGRIVATVTAEAARIVVEGVAMRSSDVDVVAVRALGWPVYRGGPLYAASASAGF